MSDMIGTSPYERHPGGGDALPWCVELLTGRTFSGLDEYSADLIQEANEGSRKFPQHELPPPSSEEISQGEHERLWMESMKAQAASAGLSSLSAAVVEEPAVEEEVPPPKMLRPDDPDWREVVLRPSMASAMMFALYPVIHSAVQGEYDGRYSDLIHDLGVWNDSLLPEREALIGLFSWITQQAASNERVIPDSVMVPLIDAYNSYEDVSVWGEGE